MLGFCVESQREHLRLVAGIIDSTLTSVSEHARNGDSYITAVARWC